VNQHDLAAAKLREQFHQPVVEPADFHNGHEPLLAALSAGVLEERPDFVGLSAHLPPHNHGSPIVTN
jgi:hypothetical protein